MLERLYGLLSGLAVAALLSLPGHAAAQQDELRASLVTIDPGALYWARFGHNALLLEQPATGLRVLYNFGLFDFEAENFLVNFVRGRMTYELGASRPGPEFDYYESIGRTVHIQQLNLSPTQLDRLAAHLEWHRTPPHDTYLYDYYLNNCSTKVRDALDLAVDGQLAEHFSALPAAEGNFRDHTRRLTSPVAWLYLGTQLGLGRPVDREISRWEEFFIPMTMMRALEDVEISWEDGSRHRLVARTTRLAPAGPIPIPASAPRWWPAFLLAGLLLACGLGAVDRGRQGSPATLTWWTFSGLIGLGLAFLWGFTDHGAAYRNENLLLFCPIALLALFKPGNLAWLRGVALILAASGAVALLLKFLPGVVQYNYEWLALALPVHLTAAGLLWQRRDTG
ncbi:MAG: DUF4105 domain-containing protein [Xanthomonadales bacterium]|nr:DUF4105 domain-containing protein [Xanthomonadales bacterium]